MLMGGCGAQPPRNRPVKKPRGNRRTLTLFASATGAGGNTLKTHRPGTGTASAGRV
ncbi:MAG: hypothetical protein CM1200mP29_08120 [Verrucomicrobiota bacterium]|nr:MAG: hypothetical protein CM1200mP29_08120 [Verrucomicrobiota bacterium]